MSTPQLLMIEDDARLAAMVGEYLTQSGYGVTHAGDGESGLALLHDAPVDLVVLDLMLPGIDGLEVCRRIRAQPGDGARVPVLMLTAKGDPMDRIVGLELGADDYLPKPFEPRELLARIRAVLRRRQPGTAPEQQRLRFGALALRVGVMRVLMLGAVLSAATNLAFSWLAGVGHNLTALIVVVSADNLASGIASAAFIGYLSSLTNVSYSATQYALFSSMMLLLPKFMAGFSGDYVNAYGYANFFASTALLGLPVLVLVLFAMRAQTRKTE